MKIGSSKAIEKDTIERQWPSTSLKADLHIHVTSPIIALTANHLQSLVLPRYRGFQEGEIQTKRGRKNKGNFTYLGRE